ncbi:MAG: RDD family protein [Luteimonas sp.]
MSRVAKITSATHPGGFWRRCAAWSLDAAIVGLPLLALTWSHLVRGLRVARAAFDALSGRIAAMLSDGLATMQDPQVLLLQWLQQGALRAESETLQAALWDSVQPALTAFIVVAAVYWIVFEHSSWQATPGKRALGLVVVDAQGRRLSLGRSIARHCAGALSWITCNLGHALAAVPPDKRALHDRIAGTRVLQHDAPQTRLPAWAIAWLVLQALVGIVATYWLFRALRVAAGNAL